MKVGMGASSGVVGAGGSASSRGTMQNWPSSDSTPCTQLVVVSMFSFGCPLCPSLLWASEYLVMANIMARTTATTINTDEIARFKLMAVDGSVPG